MRYLAMILLGGLSLFIVLLATTQRRASNMSDTLVEFQPTASASEQALRDSGKLAKATFGSGCFWCTEAVFQQLKGVSSVVSGYSGGQVKDPTYKQVSGGKTGHAEVVQITYDPAVITYAELLQAFWYSHDPTTLNRQGHEVGTQYRSAIFYHDDDQRTLAEQYKRKLDDSGAFDAPIVTEIASFTEFYPAEQYHQDYFEQNLRQPYCARLIRPKVEKFREVFKDKLKSATP